MYCTWVHFTRNITLNIFTMLNCEIAYSGLVVCLLFFSKGAKILRDKSIMSLYTLTFFS